MTDNATPQPFTLTNHDDSPTRGGSSLDAMPCCGSSGITLTCQQCGKTFREIPSHHWRKYCGQECYGKAKTAARYTMKPCPECGKMKKTRFDREPTRCEPGCRGKETSRILKEKGWNPYKSETEESREKRLSALRTEKHRELVSSIKKGVPLTTAKTKRNSAQHFKAITGILRSPRNTTHRFKNLTKFVRDNKHLFTEEETRHKPYRDSSTYRCNAISGLMSVISGRRGTWKGWTVVSFTETFYNRGESLLSGESSSLTNA